MAADPHVLGEDQAADRDEPAPGSVDPASGVAPGPASSPTGAGDRAGEVVDVRERLATAVGPLLDRVGGQLVEPAQAVAGDVPLVWGGTAELFVRLGSPKAQPRAGERASADLSDGLARLIAEVEAELGGHLASLRRAEKQRAVRLLEERGAFEVRRSTETVAEALGVTRFTVYNYLNRAREPQG